MELVDQLLAILAGPNPHLASQQSEPAERPPTYCQRTSRPGTTEGEIILRSRNLAALVSLVFVAFAVAACSSGGDQTTGGGGRPASTELTTSIVEYQFTPDTWKVPAGEQITITITNDGTVKHEWVLLQEGVRIATEADLPQDEEELMADFVNVEEEVEPGETTTLTFQAPPAGTYQVICAIEGHFDAGLKGTLNSEG